LDILTLLLMPLTDANLNLALQLLGDLLAASKKDAFDLVVCGGSALLAQGIVTRATHDVDVLAQRNLDYEILRAHPLPDTLAKAAKQVAEELKLDDNWLNSAASFHGPDYSDLPRSFWTDLETRAYGPYLRVSFVKRAGQIQLKLYASLNRAKPRLRRPEGTRTRRQGDRRRTPMADWRDSRSDAHRSSP
jgi:hypothetical protein